MAAIWKYCADKSEIWKSNPLNPTYPTAIKIKYKITLFVTIFDGKKTSANPTVLIKSLRNRNTKNIIINNYNKNNKQREKNPLEERVQQVESSYKL